ECVRNLDGERQDQFSVQWATTNAVLQREPVQKLHSDETFAFVFADFVDGADIGMIQGGSRSSLAAESFKRLRVLRHILGKELECDKSAERGVLGLVDNTHPTPAELVDDAVVRDGLADHGLADQKRLASFVQIVGGKLWGSQCIAC